jgi:exodeoxyribonuclease (lambda-induced)
MLKHNVEQKSPEWFALRLEYPLTASEAQAIGNNGKGLETLCLEKMAERYSSAEKEMYTNKDLERGVELEGEAKSLYELETGLEVETVGFITNEKVSKVAGASPDGLVGTDGCLEIKAFADCKHFKMIADLNTKGDFDIESQYMWQMQMQMLITGRKWTDFVAFNPNYKKSLLIKRVKPDKEMQKKIKEGLKKGEKFINEIIKAIT